MGSGVPLLNEYKQEFFWKRFPQTLLGGPKLKLGYEAPAYVYISQIILFVVPWILGGVCTILVELADIDDETGMYIFGGLIIIYSLTINILSEVLRNKPGAVKATQANVLTEEDEIEFLSCFGFETVEFVTPGKKYKLNIVVHSLLAGVVGGLGFWYVLPQTVNALYSNNVAATVLIYIFGWLSLLTGLYSLIVGPPPEPATYRTTDLYEISHLMRPFYLMVFYSFHLIARHESGFHKTNQVLHIVYTFLPLLWIIGLLPALDALILWVLEQALIVLFGGSPMASDIRLVVMSMVSMVAMIAVYYIPFGVITVILMAALGYLLSIDLGSLGSQLLKICRKYNKVWPVDGSTNWRVGFLWQWGIKEAVFHLVMLILVSGLAGCVNYLVRDDSSVSDYAEYLAYICMALLVIEVTFSEVQSVYVLFGLWRNKLYPSSAQRTTIFHKGKDRLKVLGHIRRVLINFVSPLAMLVYLSLSMTFDESGGISSAVNLTVSDAARILGANRAYRWVWQSTQSSLLEVSVAQILQLILPSDSDWISLGLAVQLLVISFCRDRLSQVCHKLYLWFLLLTSSWTDKKQRRDSTMAMIGLNIFLFPVMLGLMLAAAMLSAPLLPLFTLPVFLIGYPRPQRSWPEPVGSSANVCPDTVYYRQFAPHLAEAIREAYAQGSLGDPYPGKQLLVRFQDRMAWVVVLERGYAYCTISIKGLELQETSCHTVEAARLDDMFEIAFEKEGGFSPCSWNPYPVSVLRPYDVAYVKTYSDARNVLTGVMDSPEALKQVDTGFIQALVWTVLHSIKDGKEKEKSKEMDSGTARSKRHGSGSEWQKLEEERGSTRDIQNKQSAVAKNTKDFREGNALNSSMSRPSTAKSRNTQRSLSIKSFSSTWSDDNESLIMEPIHMKNKNQVNLVSGFKQSETSSGSGGKNNNTDFLPPVEESKPRKRTPSIPGLLDTSQGADELFAGLNKRRTPEDDVDDGFDEFDFGLPAVDHSKEQRKAQTKTLPNTHSVIGTSNLGESANFKSAYSRLLVPPLKWQQLPVEEKMLQDLADRFPKAWYRHVLELLDLKTDSGKSAADLKVQISEDETLEKVYNQLIMTCYAIVNILGVGGMDAISLGTSHVYKVYSGNISWSMASSFITDDEQLLNIVLKAFRYAVKLSIDQQLLGEVSSFEELQEYMEEYDRDWYIGSERDPGWANAVLREKPSLFSLGHNTIQGTYSSRTLTNQDTVVYMGSLNDEVVRGQWANLALELLYMTNDDEERYSIQAHAAALRNLTVQAADPPLGYPIYASEPLAIPTL